MATAVFFHAHPDDEAIATGGTMARMAGEGHRVVLVTATRGELGEVPEDLRSSGETLAERRAAELAAACEALGVSRHENLGYLDSGMAGTDANDDPRCFARADLDEAAGRLAAILAEEGATVLTAYDEHGNYGHPDHIQVHRVGMRAAELAGTGRVFMATMNRDHLRDLIDSGAGAGFEPPEDRRAELDTMGVEAARVTTAVDVRPWLTAKRDAMRAHASQIAETSFFLAMPEDVFALVWGTEWYVRVGAQPSTPWEDSLLEATGAG